jgi:thiol-disulfide isomerase/thioredoxin
MAVNFLLVVAILSVAAVFGVLRKRGAGRVRLTAAADRLHAGELGGALGERATFVQFSAEVCQPCRATARVLTDLAAAEPGVTHIELDAEDHLALVRRLGVLRTPTVFVLDRDGVIVGRAAGAMRKGEALSALAAVGAAG